ncbi:hypothetical protein KY348_03625 [Candidatus Woesearchaeota archaeon]|nr:hypothetical protein [Candidatus Woesearchaeota archaeon]
MTDELFGKKKKKKEELFKDLDVDLDSDLPVHEKFVDEKGLREMKGKKKKQRRV